MFIQNTIDMKGYVNVRTYALQTSSVYTNNQLRKQLKALKTSK